MTFQDSSHAKRLMILTFLTEESNDFKANGFLMICYITRSARQLRKAYNSVSSYRRTYSSLSRLMLPS